MNASVQRALDYLAAHRVATVATHGPEGPWAAAVFYASRGFDLYFLSSPRSRHAGDIALSGRAAATVQEDYAEWSEIMGIQLEGAVEMLSGSEEARAKSLYASKFPFTSGAAAAPDAIVTALARVRWYRLVATRAWFVDNTLGFGHRDQVL